MLFLPNTILLLSGGVYQWLVGLCGKEKFGGIFHGKLFGACFGRLMEAMWMSDSFFLGERAQEKAMQDLNSDDIRQ